jgi:hypothetical protein
VFAGLCNEAASDTAAVRIAARYDARIAHVETIGTLFNGKEDVGGGSGLLVGDNLVLTNNHVIPLESNYKQLQIFVRLKSRLTNPVSVTAIHRDPQRDLALLEIPTVSNADGARCPMPVILQPDLAPVGTSVFVMGYPLDQDLSLSGGLVSNHGGQDPRWQTDSVVNPGNSGGPVFEEHAALVGIAVGGIVKWTYGGETHNVNGVNFFIPSSEIVASPLFATITGLPPDRRCWTEAETFTAIATNKAAVPNPTRINRNYTISETKDDHPVVLASHSRDYSKRFEAEPGYRVVACTFHAESANHSSDPVCNIGAGGNLADFTFRLESGPQFDRWRGWWAGIVTLSQEIRN